MQSNLKAVQRPDRNKASISYVNIKRIILEDMSIRLYALTINLVN